jgi:hypothetical protein
VKLYFEYVERDHYATDGANQMNTDEYEEEGEIYTK